MSKEIGCGCCILEEKKTCSKHKPKVNKARDCDDYEHWEDFNKKIHDKIERNRDLINRFLSSNLPIKMIRCKIESLSESNKFLIDQLVQIDKVKIISRKSW